MTDPLNIFNITMMFVNTRQIRFKYTVTATMAIIWRSKSRPFFSTAVRNRLLYLPLKLTCPVTQFNHRYKTCR